MEIYSVTTSGETTFVTAPTLKEALQSDQVLIIIDDDLKLIFLWKGKNSSVAKKFIGARLSQSVRGEKGLLYKVLPVDQEEEPPELLGIYEKKPAESHAYGKSMDMTEGKGTEELAEGPVAGTLSKEIKDKIMNEALPTGFEREGIVIGTDYYGFSKSVSSVLGKTVESSDIQKAEDLPDGQLFDNTYGIRLLVEKGKVTVVEILKRKE